MQDISPEIWRRVRVPTAFTLRQLHRVLQVVFSRLDYHLYEFEIAGRRFEEPSEESQNENPETVAIAELNLTKGARFTYLYDYGDDWVHDITVEEIIPMPSLDEFDWSPRLLDGARAAPPEDAGGPPGFADLVKSLKRSTNSDHATMRQWVGPHYDPNKFDAWATDQALALATFWGAIK
jgi:hypothetical protein